jgi:hypothetical protein
MAMTKDQSRLRRRALLGGLAGTLFALPFFESLAPKEARAAGQPKRLVVFFTPNGTVPDAWVNGGETDFTLGPILTPLAPHRDDLVILTGMNNESAYHGPGDDHQRGMGTMLTGIEMEPGQYKGGCDTCPAAGFAGGASIDQVIAQQIGHQTKLASIELGVQVHDSDDWSRMSYSGPGTPMPPIDDPALTYDRLFKDLDADPAGQKRLSEERHMVLAAIMGDADKLRPKLGSDDRTKLDQHLSSLESIDKHLDQIVTVGGQCQKPGAPNGVGDIYDPAQFELIGKLQMDMLVMALTCDVTRVGSIQWTRSVGDIAMSWLGVPEGHHALSHYGLDDQTARDYLVKINTWYAEQLGYLIAKMKGVTEGTGTLLDNTVIFWCNELAVGSAHSHNDMRFLLAGGCGGAIKTGRHLHYNGDPHNNLLVSLGRAMDLDMTTFGNPAYCTGPLAKL